MVLGNWPPLDLCEIECYILNKTTDKRTSETLNLFMITELAPAFI
jgi:hypothetical protein